MANPYKFYLRDMNNKTGFRATWDPGKPLKIGLIGKLDQTGIFTVFTSLEKEGIPIEVFTDTSKQDMDFTSSDSVTISVKLAGSAPLAGSALSDLEAGFSFDFKSDKSVVFQTVGNKTHQLTNLGQIEDLILDKFHNDNWDKDWLIVTQLIESEAGTILISNSSNGKLELKAKADAGTQNLKLTDVSLGLTVAREQGSTIKVIAQEGLTPLYRVMGLRHPLFGSIHLDTRANDEEMAKEEFRIQEFDEGELD
jgi:hypothetical protein